MLSYKKPFVKNSIIIKQLMRFLKIVFLLYYIYSGIIFYSFYDLHDRVLIKNQFIRNNWNLARSLNTNFILLKVMNIMNITDFDITKNFYRNFGSDPSLAENKDFINSNLEIENKLYFIYDQIEDLHRMEKTYPDDQNFINYLYDYIDCDIIFKDFTDSIYTPLGAKYAQNKTKYNFDLMEEVNKICKTYEFMKLKSVFKIFEELNFETRSLYNKFGEADRSVNELLEIYTDEISYDISVIILFVLRPVRERTRENMMYPMEHGNIQNYLLVTIAFLILNFVVDLIIFYLINKNIIKKVLHLNDDFRSAIKCFRITS